MLDDPIIPTIKYNSPKDSMSTIVRDLHYINKDGKLTSPWLNFDAVQKSHLSQKNVFSFSAPSDSPDVNAENKENHDNILESIEELTPIVTYDDIKKESTHEPKEQLNVHKKTIKIPYSLFVKIHTFRYPPIEALLDQEEVPAPENSLEMEKILKSELLEINQKNQSKKDLKVHIKTFKIPFTLFTKIHNFRYPPIEAPLVQEEVSYPGHNHEMEEVLEPELLELNQKNQPKKDLKIQKKTIIIPYSLFVKIHTFRYPPIEVLEEQKEASNSGHKLEKEKGAVEEVKVEYSADGNQPNVENNKTNKLSGQTETRLKSLKLPFSTFAEIDNFLHFPLFGSTIQNIFKFIDPSNNKNSQMDTKLFDTITYHHEQPYCHLIGFKSHELFFSASEKNIGRGSKNEQNDSNRAVAVPIHTPPSIKEGETNNIYPNHKYVYTRVPVIIGEYNIEVCLDTEVLFEEKVYQVKEISKVIELTHCKFVPTKFSKTASSRDRIALTGKLFIEGNIHQSIEYIAIAKEQQPLYPLHQNIVIELIIQLLQVQTVINQQLTFKENS